MRVTAMIATRNRRDDLARTLTQLGALTPPPDEILVTLDGCTDGSAEMLRTRFPHVNIRENAVARGSIPSRDAMLRAATGDLVLSLDDDSYPVERDFLAQVVRLFASDPTLVLACFPQRSDEFPASLTQSEFGPDRQVGSYSSSGAVLRRSTYVALPGYVGEFSHAYEEPDYALQCIAAGADVRLHTGLTIRHHYSAVNRNEIRVHHHHARNEFWSILLRCPSPWWPFLALRRALGQAWYAARRGPGWLLREPQWWWSALRGIGTIWPQRRPVAWTAYRRWLRRLRAPEPLTATQPT